ncbi:LysM peptidoglycan-binding domain-containing protein [Paenibacillus allorhizosphaerae]|uniref:LysM domain-containing protein n=1 Tax=Paenibacillus allorhizosphaerae TaxID=2849866 RepID=A0ABM8VH51_9BACL|nr:LysM peptidoglycan-binding domain-containing protein [Paenibacillus allorhizosphaerae]CAG7640778.1 hypothetical protein PAECIP111802_02683 [Paenibacillus allorhizosphaerae]
MEKAKIFIDKSGQGNFTEHMQVLFNPTEYSIEASNKYTWQTIPGLTMPIGQFKSGNTSTLSMELFFDTYEVFNGQARKPEDVRTYTSKITSLLEVESDLHAPPVCKFVWGSLEFVGIIEKVSQKYTMFLESGIPVRAKLSVTFKSWKSKKDQVKKNPQHSADRTKHQMLNQGEQLWMIAAQQYDDPAQWREIAKANGIDNPRILPAGSRIVVPRLH